MRREADVGGAETVSALLGAGDPAPVVARVSDPGPPVLVVCDHAGRAVPRKLGRLGLPDRVFDTHIAWDIGALGYATGLADRLGCALFAQTYSRLVIDCNRDPAHPASVPEVSDRIFVPGNKGLSQAARKARIDEIHAPYHAALAAEIDRRLAAGDRPLLICAHSFTPKLQHDVRPWHVSVLHGGRSPASETLLRLLRDEGDLVVGDNEPYAMDGTDYTAPVHAWARGLDVVELEVRQDLIADAAGQARFADLFARLLPRAADG